MRTVIIQVALESFIKLQEIFFQGLSRIVQHEVKMACPGPHKLGKVRDLLPFSRNFPRGLIGFVMSSSFWKARSMESGRTRAAMSSS